MLNTLMIRSKMRDYALESITDFSKKMKDLTEKGSFFIVDTHVYKIYRDKIDTCVPKDRLCLLEATEHHKTLEGSGALIKQLIDKGIRKNNTLVAIGGGIIQDLTAFVGSMLFRGIEWIFIPTTLLAQADSCIGGKTSINFDSYKNVLGNFYPPSRILIDIHFLESLSEEDIKSGIGEMLHFYFIAGSARAAEIAQEYEKLFQERSRLQKYIMSSLEIKKGVIERDEFDRGIRNLFNYGHTFGHAIESITDYAIPHGQAVTVGMDIANFISRQCGMLDQSAFDKMHDILRKNMPAFEITADNWPKYKDALSKDKKNVNDDLTCILTEGPGRMKKVQIPLDEQLRNQILSCFEYRTVRI